MSSEFQPSHFCHEEKEEAVINEEESEELCDINVSNQEGSSEVLEEGFKKVKGRKTKSSGDVRNDDVTNATNSSLPSSPVFTTTPVIPTSPPLSRRKRLFNSLRNRTRRLRGKTRDKDATGEFPPDPICTTDEEGVSHETHSLAVSGRKSEIVRPVGLNDGFVTTITTNKTNALKKQANEDTEMATVPNDESEKEESGEVEEGIAVVEKPSLTQKSTSLQASETISTLQDVRSRSPPIVQLNSEALKVLKNVPQKLKSGSPQGDSSLVAAATTARSNLKDSSLSIRPEARGSPKRVISFLSSRSTTESLSTGSSVSSAGQTNAPVRAPGGIFSFFNFFRQQPVAMQAPIQNSQIIRPPLQPKLVYHEYTYPQQKIHSLKGSRSRQKFVIRARKKDSKRNLVATSSHEINESAFGRRFKMAKTLLSSCVRTSQRKVKRLGSRLRKFRPFRKKGGEDDSEEEFYKDIQEEQDEYSSDGGSIEPSSSFSHESLDHSFMQDTEEGEIYELSELEHDDDDADDDALAGLVSSRSLDASQSDDLSMKVMYASEYDFDDDSDDNDDDDVDYDVDAGEDDGKFADWSILRKRFDQAYSETKTTLTTERMTVIDDYTTESDTDKSESPSVSVKNVKYGNLQQRQNALMEHSFFMLEVRLKEGRDLVVRDSCGTSDPYVKFKVGGRVVYKSRIIFKNLSPKWDETFTIPLNDISKPILVKVFDYDRGLHDDPMGTSVIDMSQLELGKPTELKLMLSDRGKSDYMGYLLLTCSLIPKTQEEKEQYYNQKSVRKVDPSKKLKMQQWSSVVTILLVDGKDLVPMDDNGLSDPYVKFKLGNEKYRSKHKNKTLNPRWLEQFDLRLYEDQPNILEINVFDYDVTAKDDFMGRAVINLAELEQEVTHTLNVELEDGAGVLKLMLTISGSAGQESASGLCNFTPSLRQHNEIRKRYSIMKSFSQMEDVGFLQVKVFKAEGLKGADLSGLSDPFCVLELVNSRVQTHTEFKTLNPEWNKIFTFKLKDIHSALDITVYDADRSGKFEFLGRVAIPLLKITSGERKWYSLKDKKLVHRTKGAILLEMDLVFNPVKAAIRTVNPAEQKIMQLEPKFRINVMKTNIERVSRLVNSIIEIGQFLKSCFNWESKPRSATAFLVFLIMVWNFEPYLLPVSLLLLFLKNLIIAHLIGAFKRESIDDVPLDEDEDEDDEDKEKIPQPKEEKKSFKERLQSIQDVCLQVQQGMDKVASLGERIKNTFNWSVPWLSTLAVVVLSVAAIILYLVPLRIIVLIWGINKFTKKLRKPKAISNNEVLDFLSRVPRDKEVIEYRELKLDIPSSSNKKKRS